MVVRLKDVVKMIGIFIISYCAVFVCTLFLNYYIDVAAVKDEITSEAVMVFYNAQLATAKVVSGVSGGCLLATSVVMLFFYIRHYIDTHRKELGILKALGYSDWKIARGFYVFGLSIFGGTAAGFGTSFLLMPAFYEMQNKDKMLPEYSIHFHPALAFYLVIIPTIFFALSAIFYACFKLKLPVLKLLRDEAEMKLKRVKKYNDDLPFLEGLRKSTVGQRKSLVFFIGFAAFCFASMIQMSFSMTDLASEMCAIMIFVIGILLACVTLFLAVTTVINASKKTIAMMRIFGYSLKECSKSILSGYRFIAYIGFAAGTGYQYALLKIMVSVVFKDIEGVPEYSFDVQAFIIALIAFAFLYELVMYCYSKQIEKISLKEVMAE